MAHSFYPYAEYTKFDGNWLFETPSHWQIIPLKYLCRFYGGGTPSKDNLAFWKGDIPWVSPKDMKTQLLCDTEDHITEAAVENSSTQMIEEGALLIVVRSGILQHTIPVTINKCSVALNQDMKGLSFDSRTMPEFVKYFITGNQSDLLLDWRKQGATVESIEHEYLANSILPTPPIHEQRTIVAFLDHETAKIDTLIEKQQQLIKLLKEKRQAVISHAVTKGLNPDAPMKDSGVEWLGEVPEHWEVTKLYHCTSQIGDGLHATPSYEDATSHYFINGNNLANGVIRTSSAREVSLSEYKKHFIELDDNSLLLSINGTIGNVAFYNNEKVILGKSASFINCLSLLKREFLYLYLQSDHAAEYYNLERTGTTIFNLSLNSIRQMAIGLPSTDEQCEIIDYCHHKLDRLNRLIDKSKKVVSLLKERRTALISAAVTGKIDVRNWTPQSATDMQQETTPEPVATPAAH